MTAQLCPSYAVFSASGSDDSRDACLSIVAAFPDGNEIEQGGEGGRKLDVVADHGKVLSPGFDGLLGGEKILEDLFRYDVLGFDELRLLTQILAECFELRCIELIVEQPTYGIFVQLFESKIKVTGIHVVCLCVQEVDQEPVDCFGLLFSKRMPCFRDEVSTEQSRADLVHILEGSR